MNESIEKYIAASLLDIGAIKLNVEHPFQWSSGWKSPIYCDNRLSLSYPEIRSYIKNALVGAIKKSFTNVEAIAGVATAGIPQGALVADAMELPYLYVRSKPKGHGMENRIEGKVAPGQNVVLVEDLISTGGSSLKAAEALQAVDMKVAGLISIFTYGFQEAEDTFKTANIPVTTLSNYSAMLEIALEKKMIAQSQIQTIENWRKDPAGWGA